MPQLDKYIFLNQIISLVVFFFLLYFYIRSTVLPLVNGMLKYRIKKFEKLHRHEKGNWRLFNNANSYFSQWAVSYLNVTMTFITTFVNEKKQGFSQKMVGVNKKINKLTSLNFSNLSKDKVGHLFLLNSHVIYTLDLQYTIEIKRLEYYLQKTI